MSALQPCFRIQRSRENALHSIRRPALLQFDQARKSLPAVRAVAKHRPGVASHKMRFTAAAAGWSDRPLIACARTFRQSGVVRVLQTARIMEATELLPSAFKNNEVAECRNQRHAQDPVS